MRAEIRAELAKLVNLSAELGQDLNLVQAGGGNTSIKLDGTLWVKASGKWLARARQEEMFLPVPMAEILQFLDRGEEYTVEQKLANGTSLRPSVETAMHAVLPDAVVVHLHSVNTITWAVRMDGEAELEKRLAGLPWMWVPYLHPGMPLAVAIQRAIQDRAAYGTKMLVLENHGLVVTGEDTEDALTLLRHVEKRMASDARPAPGGDLAALTDCVAGMAWKPATDIEVHALASDEFSMGLLANGTLFPDQCVYVGPGAAAVSDTETIDEAVSRYRAKFQFEPKILLVAGKGVLTTRDFSRAGAELLVCLKRIAERIPSGTTVRYLSVSNVNRLLNWDAEAYRIALAREQEQNRVR